MKLTAAHIVDRVERASHRWSEVLMAFGAFLVIGVMLLVVSDVTGRYVFSNPIKGAVELEQIVLAFIAFLCLAYGLVRRTHLRVTLVTSRLSPRGQAGTEIIAGVVGLTFLILMTWGATEQFWASWSIQEIMWGLIPFPFWIPKLAMLVGAIDDAPAFVGRLLLIQL